jgi:hypothetical protein
MKRRRLIYFTLSLVAAVVLFQFLPSKLGREDKSPSDGANISEAEVRKLATQYRDDWLTRTNPESADILRIGVIKSIGRDGDVWDVQFVTETGRGTMDGREDYVLHVYLDRTGKLQKIERGPGLVT